MQTDTNPYEAPTQLSTTSSEVNIRRPFEGTFLLCLFLLEGCTKAFFIGAGVARGFNPFPDIVANYPERNRFYFFLAASFIFVETIGPWVGIYYLTRRRYREIPLNTVVWTILMRACGIAMIFALLIMLYCEIALLIA